MGEEKREQKGGGGMGSCYPVRSAVNVRANMFWFFFFLVDEYSVQLHLRYQKWGPGVGSIGCRLTAIKRRRRHASNPSTWASPVR